MRVLTFFLRLSFSYAHLKKASRSCRSKKNRIKWSQKTTRTMEFRRKPRLPVSFGCTENNEWSEKSNAFSSKSKASSNVIHITRRRNLKRVGQSSKDTNKSANEKYSHCAASRWRAGTHDKANVVDVEDNVSRWKPKKGKQKRDRGHHKKKTRTMACGKKVRPRKLMCSCKRWKK